MTVVYVLSKDGRPLMPTARCGHIRILLKQKKARVISPKPFTVQLLYDSPENTQPVVLGIDPGRINIGLCAVRKDTGKPVFTAQLETRNKEIPKLMEKRKIFRQKHRKRGRREVRQRRACAAGTISPKCEKQETGQGAVVSKRAEKIGVLKRQLPGCEKPVICIGIKNKETRFHNRIRPAGWLTPTADHLLRTHINTVRKIRKFLPVTDVMLELNKFAFMALDNPGIRKWMYQNGSLKGYEDVEAAVSEQQGGHCLFCGKGIEHFHHIVSRRRRGSNIISNIAGLCAEHHALVHKDKGWAEKLREKKQGMNKKYGALSVLNQIIPKLAEALSLEFPERCFATEGKSTKTFREAHGIGKDHYLDAYCVACSILPAGTVTVPCEDDVFHIRQFRRHDRQACHQERLNRKYKLDGKIVAANRHKATDQRTDSLEEFVAAGGCVDKLIVPVHTPVMKRMDRIMPGAVFMAGSKKKVMFASQGMHNGKPDYYCFVDGTKGKSRNCKQIRENSGIVFV